MNVENKPIEQLLQYYNPNTSLKVVKPQFAGRLDMDGVLVNFNQRVCEVIGIEYPTRKVFPGTSYWIADQLGTEEPIRRAMATKGFWEDLDPFPWASQIVDLVDEVFEGNWIFCTKAAKNCDYCHSEKYRWILKHFPKHADKLWMTLGKKTEVCRSEFDVLIDDTWYNVEHWQDAGGTVFRWFEMTPDIPDDIINTQLLVLKHFLHSKKRVYNSVG